MLTATRRGKESMNFITAFLLLRMDEEGAFWTLAMVLGEPKYMKGYYQADMVECQVDQLLLADLLQTQLPSLHRHLEDLEIQFNTLAMRWFLVLFISVLPTESTMRVWDIFLREGRSLLFRVALAVLKVHLDTLLAQDSFEECVELLKELLLTTYNADALIETAMYDEELFSLAKFEALEASKRNGYLQQVIAENADLSQRSHKGQPPSEPSSPTSPKALSDREATFKRIMQMLRVQDAFKSLQADYRFCSSVASRIQGAWRLHKARKLLNEHLWRSWEYYVQDISTCWEELVQPLVYRSEFYLQRCDTSRVGLCRLRGLRTEARRLHAKRHKIRRDNPNIPLNRTADILEAQDAMKRERQTLYKKLKTDLSDKEKELLFQSWGVQNGSKARKEQLISLIWTPQADSLRSTGLVLWLCDASNMNARRLAISADPVRGL